MDGESHGAPNFPPAPPLDSRAVAEGERDNTSEWVLPAEARPATLAQLEQRVDHALAVARASEAAAREIGAAAIDAAEQARRAAELAERASRGGGAAAANGTVPSGDGGELAGGGQPAGESEPSFDSFKHFLERADRVTARLEAIAPVPSAERSY